MDTAHHDHASRLAAAWAADPHAPAYRSLQGTAVLADLSGFTRLTELLEARRAEGPEAMYDVMTACFGALLSRCVALGGDVIGFAGDAALVWFEGDEHELRAVEAAGWMPHDLGAVPADLTGGRRLRVSVGVHTGRLDAVLTRTDQRGLFLCGQDVSTLTGLQTDAGRDQVLVSGATGAMLPEQWLGDAVGRGRILRRRPPVHEHTTATTPAPIALHADAIDRTMAVLSPTVRTILDARVPAADHRTVTVGFLRAHGTDALAAAGPEQLTGALEHVAGTVVRVCRELSVEWLDTDVGVDNVKVLLTAGAPLAVTHDEHRMLLAMRRIVDECEVPLRGGVQRGNVFAALLGIPGRRSYTILADAANVAARCLSLASDGEVVAGDALGLPHRPGVITTPLGTVHFKNRVQPMAVWRVGEVAPTVDRSPSPTDRLGALRHIERRQLAEMWKHTVDGEGRTVAVSGEPGMGASALLHDVVDLAGAAATSVAGDPFGRHVPYGVVERIVRDLAVTEGHEGDPWDRLRRHVPGLPSHLQDWAHSAIDAAHGVADGSADPRSSENRTRLVLAALLAAAAPRPWLLAVDELDDIDSASRSVLTALLSFTASQPLMVVSAGVPGGAALVDPFVASTTITLGPIHHEEARQVVIDAAPHLRDDQVDALVAAARGNPFVLLELTRHPDLRELPDSLRRLGALLIDSLPARDRALARDAATLGPSWTSAEAATALGRPELSDLVTWSGTRAVIVTAPDGTMSFRHEAYRAAAYQGLPHRRRRSLHGSIADRLGAVGAPSALLAVHLDGAGRFDAALPHARAAAAAAKATGAIVDAAALFARAVALARRTAAPDLAELLTEQGDTLVWLGDLRGAGRAFAAAAPLARNPATRTRLHHLRANLALDVGSLRSARAHVRTGGTVATAHGLTGAHALLVLDESSIRSYAGRLQESADLAEAGLALAEQTGEDLTIGLGHLFAELAYSMLMDERAVPHGAAAVRIFERIGHDRYLAGALNNHGLTLMHLGRWQDAIDRYRAASDLAERAGRPLDRAMVEMNIGYIRLRQGLLEDARVAAVRTRRVFDTVGQEQQSGMARMLLALVAAREGRMDDADEHLADARARFEQVGDTPMLVDCEVVALEHLVLRGRPTEVIDRARALERRIDEAELPVRVALQRIVGQAEAQSGGDGPARGRARVAAAAEFAGRHQLRYDEYLCWEVLADLGDASARTEAARMAALFGLASRW